MHSIRRRPNTWHLWRTIAAISFALTLAGCSDSSTVQTVATVTLKNDGSKFTGKIVRQDGTTITLLDSDGTARNFILNDLSALSYGAPAATAPPQSPSEATAAIPENQLSHPLNGVIFLPPNIAIPVRNKGVLDSCCTLASGMSLGIADANVLDTEHKIAIPAGAAVTIVIVASDKVNGVPHVVFELGSVDFGTHHYGVRSAKAGQPAATATYMGAAFGTPEAKLKGENVHLEDNTRMEFKADGVIELYLQK